MQAEGLFDDDVIHAVMHAIDLEILREDSQGIRYRITGPALDGRAIQIVCRFDETGQVRFITLWSLEEEEA